jgi:hypothetical protein
MPNVQQHENLPAYLDPINSEPLEFHNFTGLYNLRELRISHQGIGNKSQYNCMLKWIMRLTPSKANLQSVFITSDDFREFKFASLAYFSVFLKNYANPRTRNGKEEPQGLRILKLPFVKFTLKDFYDAVLKAGQFEKIEIGVANKEEGSAFIVRP